MQYSSLEHYESSWESEQFLAIVQNLGRIAETIAADPEHTFNLTMKKVEVPSLGLLHWQQILEEIHVRVTERQQDNHQGVEVDCLYVHGQSGWEFADHDEAFKISTPRANRLRHGFYIIQRHDDGFEQRAERGTLLSRDDIRVAHELSQNFASLVPEILAS